MPCNSTHRWCAPHLLAARIYRCGYTHLCAITQPTGTHANTASDAVPHRHDATLCSNAAPLMRTISSPLTGAPNHVTRTPTLSAARQCRRQRYEYLTRHAARPPRRATVPHALGVRCCIVCCAVLRLLMLRAEALDAGDCGCKIAALRHVAQLRRRAAPHTQGSLRSWRHERSAPFSQVAGCSFPGVGYAGRTGMLRPLLHTLLQPR